MGGPGPLVDEYDYMRVDMSISNINVKINVKFNVEMDVT